MAEPTLWERAEGLFVPGRLDFVYRRESTSWAEVFFSDGADWWYFSVFEDALQLLIQAIVEALGDSATEACARWFHGPTESLWRLRREGDMLLIRVITLPDFRPTMPLPEETGETRLETTVDVWAFARRVRLAASRIATAPAGEQGRAVSFADDPAYRALCRLLKAHRGGC